MVAPLDRWHKIKNMVASCPLLRIDGVNDLSDRFSFCIGGPAHVS